MKKILSVVGARPNFMKMAPVHKELQRYKSKLNHRIVHTGQHYDKAMSDVFFKELELPKPHIYLGIGSLPHSEQVAKIMVGLEKVLLKEKPDLVLVYGDVNSTMAAAIVCAKLLIKNGKPIPVAHIEAGLRSFDNTMPEEINRKVTDSISSYLFVTEKSGMENLTNEGVKKSNVFFVGNTMIDSLKSYMRKTEASDILNQLALSKNDYTLVTLHRPSNVDTKEGLTKILDIFTSINALNKNTEIVFPVHPRTRKMMETYKLRRKFNAVPNLIITEPLGYLDFLSLMMNARYVLTDSGGIQEETTSLKIPCLTLRENTERPVTVDEGTNTLTGLNKNAIIKNIKKIESGKYKSGTSPKYWDGKSAQRIVSVIRELMNNNVK
ncbi:MAG: UDP-N-acetylglucosamine 2-epimerase (non-hydrolyzing) [Ignavibacteriae bacterium]|nr:UDP-N-acetylglucosamine 2-epimerase (non-hydrolyzing) [Ignavibacteriota bacterium]MCB9242362.1 UDP-N-acetylglucosamine 2-epimerase (non-hydrolyzing) [Ignavibacteriales bacterium]